MRRLLAIADLRFRGGAAARLPWLIPVAFAAGFACAGGARGATSEARAAAAVGTALLLAATLATVAVLVLAATAFARDVRTTVAHALLSAPVARATLLAGGAAGQSVFGLVLLLGTAAAAALGLDAAGLGSGARPPLRPMAAAEIADPGPDGFAVASRESPTVRARFRVPDGVGGAEGLRFRLDPRAQVESGHALDGVVALSVGPPGRPGPEHRVAYKSTVAFDAEVPAPDLAAGDEAELVIRRERGAWRLRFGPGSVEVGGARETFAWNLVKAALCAFPLLAMAALAGGAASARLGAAASLALGGALLVVVAGRDVIEDAATFVVQEAEAHAAEHEGHDPAGHHHGHAHVHACPVTPAQQALARAALVGLRAVPDAATFWRFDDLAASRAVPARDVGRAFAAGALPCGVLLAASWLLLRRREMLPE